MVSRAFAVASCLSFAALLSAGPSAALELPLPPEGEDIVGQIQVIKAKYEDTFAAIGEAHDLGYLELVAANRCRPVAAGRGHRHHSADPFHPPAGPREGIVINIAEYRMYYYRKAERGAYLPAGYRPRGLGFSGWNSPDHGHDQQPGTVSAEVDSRRARRRWRSVADGGSARPDNPLGPYKMSLSLRAT